MSERNLCKEHGCPNACCVNMNFQVVVKVEDVLKVFPEAKRKRFFSFDSENLPDGVYYLKTSIGGNAWVKIVGPCPGLEDGDCSIYEERLEPCRNFTKGSGICSWHWRERKRELATQPPL